MRPRNTHAESSGTEEVKAFSITCLPVDRPWAAWLGACLGLVDGARVEEHLWPANEGLPGTGSRAADGQLALVVVSSALEALGPPEENSLAARLRVQIEEGRCVTVMVDGFLTPIGPAQVQLAELGEADAYAALMRQLVHLGALTDGDWPTHPVLPSATRIHFPGDGPEISNLRPRDPGFSGRLELLQDVQRGLLGGQNRRRLSCVYLWGLGGMGKTSAALEYAHRFGGRYGVVWWISAGVAGDLRASLTDLAKALRVPEQADAQSMLTALWAILNKRDDWLLVFDNVEDANVLDDHWPSGGHGDVLVTQVNEGSKPKTVYLLVEKLTPEAAVDLLTGHTGAEGDPVDVAAAEAVAQTLGHLPLALAHARAYMRTAAVSLEQYRLLLESSLPDVLSRRSPDAESQSVARTWSLALSRTSDQVRGARELMQLWSMLASDDIPRELMASHADCLPASLKSVVEDRLAYDTAVQGLARYSLVRARPDGIDVHRLVQSVVRSEMVPPAFWKWLNAAVRLLVAAFPKEVSDRKNWAQCELLLAHVQTADGNLSGGPTTKFPTPAPAEITSNMGELLQRVGHYYLERSSFEQARISLKNALDLREETHGRVSAEYAEIVVLQASLLYRSAHLKDAQEEVEKALAILEERGFEDARLISALLTSARILVERSALHEGHSKEERAHRIATQLYGEDDQRTRSIESYGSIILWRQGHLRPALRTVLKALDTLERTGNEGDSETLGTRATAALIQLDLGILLADPQLVAGAAQLSAESITVLKARHSDDELSILQHQHNVARTLLYQNELTAARTLLEPLTADFERLLGAHPSTVPSRLCLAEVYCRQGESTAAHTLLQTSAAIYDRVYGATHPYQAEVLAVLGRLAKFADDLPAAERALRDARAITEQCYGGDHPKLVQIFEDLAAVLDRRATNRDEAVWLYERAQAIRREVDQE